MPVVYDPEHILEDEARTDGVTGEQFTQNAKVFCKEIEEAGYGAMIYSNMLWEAYELDLESCWIIRSGMQIMKNFRRRRIGSVCGSIPAPELCRGLKEIVDLNIQLLKK